MNKFPCVSFYVRLHPVAEYIFRTPLFVDWNSNCNTKFITAVRNRRLETFATVQNPGGMGLGLLIYFLYYGSHAETLLYTTLTK